MSSVASPAAEQFISLTQATRHAAGRPSVCAMWRWCRKGVIARNGQRVRLQHTRMGGRIYTTPAWVEEFGRALTAADERYFQERENAAARLPPRDPRYGPPTRGRTAAAGRTQPTKQRDLTEIERELDAEGI